MKSFFLASGLILLFSLLIGCYYFVRNIYYSKNKKKIYDIIRRKILTDEKEYLRNYIKYHIPRLQNNTIQWIMIWKKPNPANKIEITYNNLTDEIQVIKHDLELQNCLKLKEFGINNIINSSENLILKITPNAKIITDVIYYLFESGIESNRFINYKLITSTNFS